MFCRRPASKRARTDSADSFTISLRCSFLRFSSVTTPEVGGVDGGGSWLIYSSSSISRPANALVGAAGFSDSGAEPAGAVSAGFAPFASALSFISEGFLLVNFRVPIFASASANFDAVSTGAAPPNTALLELPLSEAPAAADRDAS